jgi:hypothetical protein
MHDAAARLRRRRRLHRQRRHDLFLVREVPQMPFLPGRPAAAQQRRVAERQSGVDPGGAALVFDVFVRQARGRDCAAADFVEQREQRVILHRRVHGERALERLPLAAEAGLVAERQRLLLQANAAAKCLVRVAQHGEGHRPGRVAARGDRGSGRGPGFGDQGGVGHFGTCGLGLKGRLSTLCSAWLELSRPTLRGVLKRPQNIAKTGAVSSDPRACPQPSGGGAPLEKPSCRTPNPHRRPPQRCASGRRSASSCSRPSAACSSMASRRHSAGARSTC